MDTRSQTNLPPDPHDGLLLENDVLGARLWGPPTQPTLIVGASDIWDRRWFGDRQPLVRLARLRELAMSDRLSEVAKSPNDTAYGVYNRYDFPCPKPGAQLILRTPFAERATVEQDERGVRLVVEGAGRRLLVVAWVSLVRRLVVMECEAEKLAPRDFSVRVYRHRDTVLPGQPVDLTIGGRVSPTDFEQLPTPRCYRAAEHLWGIAQEFPPEPTFPDGFRFVVAATALGLDPSVERREDERGLGTPLWAEREGRLDHGTVKRYTPINQAPGAAATASFRSLPRSFALLTTVATSHDGSDPEAVAAQFLDEAARLGLDALRREQAEAFERGRRRLRAQARIGESTQLAAPPVVMPRLRTPGGSYGDVPLCSVAPTKFCFQDAALWHADFHLNEIRAEPMLALGQFEEVFTFCEMIRTLLPQAEENARDVYGLPGAMYPLVHFPLRCRGIAHTNLTWEQDMGLDGLVTKPLWLYYRYTGDAAFLREVAYPALRSCARFCAAYLTEGSDGRLHLVPTVSPEHWGLTNRLERNRDCTSALTLTRYLLNAASAAAQVLGEDGDEAVAWQAAAARLVGFPIFLSESGPIWTDVEGAPPIEYNIPVPLAPVFWGDEVGLDSPPEVRALAERTLLHINVWPPHRPYLDSCVRPRLGIYRPGAPVGPENLLLSYQSIRIFPAVPSEGEIVMENFAAEGGFRVSASRTAEGKVEHVRILSTLGGKCRVANPYAGSGLCVLGANGRKIAQEDGKAAHVSFATRPGEVYEVRPA